MSYESFLTVTTRNTNDKHYDPKSSRYIRLNRRLCLSIRLDKARLKSTSHFFKVQGSLTLAYLGCYHHMLKKRQQNPQRPFYLWPRVTQGQCENVSVYSHQVTALCSFGYP